MNTSSFTIELIDTMRKYDVLQDRLAGDMLVLPNQWNDIRLKVNDVVVSETINYSLEALYKNWLYLLAYSVIPTNDIPNMDYGTHIIMDKSHGIDWEPFEDDYRNTNSVIDGIRNLTKIENTADTNNYNIIASTTTNVILMSGTGVDSINIIVNPDGLGHPIYSDSSVTHPSNGILFENIVDLTVTDNKDLFVVDNSHNIMFKFDISGITTLDTAVLKNDTPGRLLVGMVGGHGELTDKINFKNIKALTTVSNNLFVLDTDTANNTVVIKQFDSFLNWISNYHLGTIDGQSIIDFEYNNLNDSFYILTHDYNNGTNTTVPPRLTVFDSQFNRISQHDLLNFETHNSTIGTEQFKKLYFSKVNENMMYIVTNKNIYKKYVSRPTDFIGSFKFEERFIGSVFGNRIIQDICLFETILTDTETGKQFLKDEMLLFEDDYNTIYRFLEDSAFENSIETEIEEKMLKFKDLTIKPDENVDVLVYNKTIYKNLYNNLLVLENTSRKFSTIYDDKGLSKYLGFQYLNDSELDLFYYDLEMDNYISSNEIVLTETVNRCLRKIFDLQQLIADNMQEKSVNVYPNPTTTVFLN